jgi:hypothetical protein
MTNNNNDYSQRPRLRGVNIIYAVEKRKALKSGKIIINRVIVLSSYHYKSVSGNIGLLSRNKGSRFLFKFLFRLKKSGIRARALNL